MPQAMLSIWQLSAIQLLKDCGRELHSDDLSHIRSKDDLIALAKVILADVVQSGAHSLTAALYRLDISEQKIKWRTKSLSPDERLDEVAEAAAERCLRKVEMKRRFSERDGEL